MLPVAQLVHVRRLPSLRLLFLHICSQERLEVLVEEHADCPQMQLHWLDAAHGYITLKQAQLLVRLPTLRWLEPNSITPDALQLLAHGLPDLHTLKIVLTPRWGVAPRADDWQMVRDSLAACRQLTALRLGSTPLDELAALLLALPPSVRRIDLRYCDSVLRSDVIFQCLTKGGLRHVQQLRIQTWPPRDKYEAREVTEWKARMADCAPWNQESGIRRLFIVDGDESVLQQPCPLDDHTTERRRTRRSTSTQRHNSGAAQTQAAQRRRSAGAAQAQRRRLLLPSFLPVAAVDQCAG
jgi:hypothetical protein